MEQFPQDIRWKQRFQNFENAFKLFSDACKLDLSSLNDLEKEGVIQRFEYTFELAWKCLKDKMENDGIILEQVSPKNIIRQAFQAKYIDDSEMWMNMLSARNLMSHTYDLEGFFKILEMIQYAFFPLLKQLYDSLKRDAIL